MNENSTEQKIPTKEEIVTMLTEQIEIKKLQVELQELNAKYANSRAEEIRALAFIGNMTNPRSAETKETPYEGGVPHTITQEDMDKNPELAEQGLAVGDEVMIDMAEEEAEDKPKSKRALKK